MCVLEKAAGQCHTLSPTMSIKPPLRPGGKDFPRVSQPEPAMTSEPLGWAFMMRYPPDHIRVLHAPGRSDSTIGIDGLTGKL